MPNIPQNFMHRAGSFLRQAGLWLTRPVLSFYLLPWLLVLLTFGTICQRYIGLYASEKIFFGSFILWIRWIPLPGAYATLGLLALSLSAKLLLKTTFRWSSAGIFISHASVLLLLLGGLVSALTREEGYITLVQDQTTASIADYHDRMLVLSKNGQQVDSIAYDGIKEGMALFPTLLPYKVKVKSRCYPCAPEMREVSPLQLHGMALSLQLADALPSPDESLNRAGVTFTVEEAAGQQNGEYIAYETISQPPELTVGSDRYRFEMHPSTRPLPFSVQLLKFEQENHPGTGLARSYLSQVMVKDGALQWKAEISMNDPLRYRGYTIYQSSFIDNGQQTASVLAVVRNAGWLFPYIAVLTLCAGLVLHLIIRKGPAKPLAMVLMAAFMLSHAPDVFAAESTFEYNDFAAIPVLHEGRMKPLDSLARAMLRGMAGDADYAPQGPSAWLAEVLFSPQSAMGKPLFVIHSAPLVQTLGIVPERDHHYRFDQLLVALAQQRDAVELLMQREAKTLNESERELLKLSDKVELFARMAGSFSLVVPLEASAQLRKALSLPSEGELTYFKLLPARHVLMEKLKAVVAAKKNDIVNYTPLEQEMAKLAYLLDGQQKLQAGNSLLRVMPAQWNSSNEWLAPWAMLEQGMGSPRSNQLLEQWAQLMRAWNTKDVAKWKSLSAALRTTLTASPEVRPQVIALEVAYNRYSPLGKSAWCYGVALLIGLACVIRQRKQLLMLATLVTLAGLLLQGGGLLARMIILERPPVSTLYESMLFVSFISALCGLWLTRRRANAEGLVAGCVVAVATLGLADVFAGDGDTLEMLTAVLNTNFWLGTHVVCITAGYGFSLITAVMAHVYLLRMALGNSVESLRSAYRQLHWLAILSLCLTATGTMLGGIWADQSWGRFWGWDPKENGALAIVIWWIWALHGRISGHLREIGFSAVLSLATIVVALAWVGVNLLSVGLHSYGFSSQAAWGLPLFCGGELITVGALVLLSKKRYRAMQ